jgi:MFS family permease
LYFHPGAYKPLFLIAFLPGIISVLLLFKLKEQGKEKNTHIKNQFFSYFTYFKQSPAPFRWLVGGLCIFALANSSDVFLLLRAGEVLKDEQQVILGYLLYNLVYAFSAYPLGILADRIGLKKMLLAGMGIFVFAYTGFALSQSPMVIYALFGLYGLFAASTEGVAKAWIANLVPEVECGTAMGLFASLQSIGIFIASSMTGWIWEKSGYTTAFYISVLLAVLAIIWIAGFAKNMMPERA